MFNLLLAANASPAAPAAPAAPVKVAPATPAAPAAPVKVAPAAPAAPAAQVKAAPAAPATKTTATVEQPASAPKNGNAQATPPSPWTSILPFILIFVVMMFFMSRSQKKQMAKRQEMMDRITKGTAVVLTSGVYGKVVEVREDSFIVEISDNVKIRVNKSGIAAIDEPEAVKSEGK